MRFKTTFRLFIGVCLLGSLLFLVDYHARERQVRKTENQRVFDLSTERVVGISITRDDLTIECLKKGHEWFINAPVRSRGNAAAIERIVAMLEMVEWKERITAEQRQSRDLAMSDYGLAPARLRVAVDTPSRRQTLFLGDDMPLGDGLYARHSLYDVVLTVPAALAEALPTSITPLRDRAILHGSPADTVRFEIQRRESGFIQLVRQGSGWMIQQPLSVHADTAVVQQLLEALYTLRVERFFWDAGMSRVPIAGAAGSLEMAASASVESCGLAADSAQIRATVWVEGDSLGQELLLGKPSPDRDGEIYAKRGEIDAIYTVSNAVLEACDLDVNALRDCTVFPVVAAAVGRIVLIAGESRLLLVCGDAEDPTWRIEEPVQWAADGLCVRELIDHLLLLSIDAYLDDPVNTLDTLGLTPPQYSIQLDGVPQAMQEDTAATQTPLVGGGELQIGVLTADGQSRYAKMGSRDEVFLISVEAFSCLGDECINPLLYRDRTMLALPAKSVRGISVLNMAGDQGVIRDEEGMWSCVGTGQMTPALGIIKQILFAVANVRAVRIETHNPKSLEPYGLDAPVATVTFGLQGDDAIQKSLLIGGADAAGRIYAMVRGQDVVFLIPETLVALFAHPLCIPQTRAPDSAEPSVTAGEEG